MARAAASSWSRRRWPRASRSSPPFGAASLAVERAARRAWLLGFVRGGGFNVYAERARIRVTGTHDVTTTRRAPAGRGRAWLRWRPSRMRAGPRAARRARCCAPEPGRRLRLPGLRLARTRRPLGALEFCENGAKARRVGGHARARDAGVLRARTPVAELAAQDDHWLEAQGRLTEPMLLGARAATTTSRSRWDEAFARIGASCRRARRRPDQAVFYTSGPHQQRGGVPLPAVRARARHQQPARLLEHVPRVQRRRAGRDDRRRQGHGHSRTSSTPTRSSSSARTPAPTIRAC